MSSKYDRGMPGSKRKPGDYIGFFSLALIFLAPLIPHYIGYPIGVIFLCIAVWSLWGFKQSRSKPPKRRKVVTRPPFLKKALIWVGILAALVAVVLGILAFMTQPQDGAVAPESPEDGVLPPESPEDGEPPPESPEEWLWSHPSPQEIYESIWDVQPYLQDAAMQSYEGVPVTWGVTLAGVYERTSGMYYIQTWSLDDYPWLITFAIDISQYPQLKIMERGQELIIQGTITEVQMTSIELGDCQLIFDW